MRIQKIKVSDIRYGGELQPRTPIADGDQLPIIVEELQGKDGLYYDLIDGFHRLGSMITAGVVEVTAIIPTAKEFQLCAEFGGDDSSMTENDWIDYIQENA